MIHKIASAIYNDVVSGLVGITSNPTMSMEQLEDDVVDERLQIIKEYSLKNLVPVKDLVMTLNCIEVDCKSLDMCPNIDYKTKPVMHFEIPQTVNDLAEASILYIGSVDRSLPFKVYTDSSWRFHKHRRRGSDRPFVYIETSPNENNMYDGWIFNAPLLKVIAIIAVFKDPRQLEQYSCGIEESLENYSFITAEIKKRLTEKKLRYYKMFYQPPTPNTQAPK